MSDDTQALAAALMRDVPQQPVDEQAYLAWALQNKVPQSNDYNMRGFYRALMNFDPAAASSIDPNDGRPHFPDNWKLPSHETFSTDSNYYNPATMPSTPTWTGGPLPNGGASWVLRKPSGEIQHTDWPWYGEGAKP